MNNPLKYTDPSGFDFESVDDGFNADGSVGGFGMTDDYDSDGNGIADAFDDGSVFSSGTIGEFTYVVLNDGTYLVENINTGSLWSGGFDDKGNNWSFSSHSNGVGVYEYMGKVTIGNNKRSITMTSLQKEQLDRNILEAKNMSLSGWLNSVKNKGKWDYKNQNSKLEAYGNLNYGATAHSLGLSAFSARVGSFGVQVANTLSRYNNNQGFVDAMNDELYNDWQHINLGHDYANTLLY